MGTICLAFLVVRGDWAAAQQPFTVHDAVRMALTFHPEIAMADAQRDAATAQVGVARAQRLPTLIAQASATRFQEPMIVAPLHAFDPSQPPVFDQTLIQSRWAAEFTLFDGGLRGARVRQANAMVSQTDAQSSASTMAVIENVVVVYLRVLTARGVVDAQRQRLASLDAERQRVNQLLGEGRAARVELLRVEAAMAQGRADLTRAEQERATAVQILSRIIGLPTDLDPSRFQTVALAAAARIDPPEQLRSRARKENPIVEAARQQLAARDAARRAATAARFPTINLSAGYVTFASANGDFVGEWQGGIGIAYSIFGGGERSRRVAEAGANIRAAQERLRLTELELDNRFDELIAAVQAGQAQASAMEQAVTHLTEVARIERLSLDAGAGVQTDYLRAETDLAAARASLAETRNAVIAARVALARTMSELDREWMTRVIVVSQP